MKALTILIAGVFVFALSGAMAQDAAHKHILLWPDGAPGSEGKTTPERVSTNAKGEMSVTNVNFPSITPYLPAKGKANGIAMIIAPGGGGNVLKIDYEGSNFAEWLADKGVTAFVLRYRLAKEANSVYTVDGHSVKDMQRAIRLVRSRASEWGIDTARIGAMGFSAGGEVAGLATMRFDYGDKSAKDIVDKQSSRPNFQVLVYPGGSTGIEPQKNSPPLFLAGGSEDSAAMSTGLAGVYIKFRNANIPVEMHIYAKAPHGFGVRKTTPGAVIGWTDRFYDWLKDMGFLATATTAKAK